MEAYKLWFILKRYDKLYQFFFSVGEGGSSRAQLLHSPFSFVVGIREVMLYYRQGLFFFWLVIFIGGLVNGLILKGACLIEQGGSISS